MWHRCFIVYTPKSLCDAQFSRHVLIDVLGKPFCTLTYPSLTRLSVFYREVSGLLFAINSVRATMALLNDLFLVYTSAAFAMLGSRATF